MTQEPGLPQTLPTQPIPPHIAAVRDTLAAIGGAAGADTELRIAVADAQRSLCDVWPPYPPARPTHDQAAGPGSGAGGGPVDADAGILLALRQLVAAIDASADVQEAVRCGLAADRLRRWLGIEAGNEAGS
jgi:hypothetical protein